MPENRAHESKPLNIVFAGTPEFAAIHLRTLINSHHNLLAVYTQPDRPSGRGKKTKASPVKQDAEQAHIPVIQPSTLKTPEAQTQLASFEADIMVVVAYGMLLPEHILDTPRLGCINVHASLLPRWRGAAPIQRAIEAGDQQTGITIMQMDKGLDTGDMLSKLTCTIGTDDTASSLHNRLATLGPEALLDTLGALAEGSATANSQDDTLATYANKLSKQEASLDWSANAEALHRKIRAFNPFPVAKTELKGLSVRIHNAELSRATHHSEPGTILSHQKGIQVACGDGNAITLTSVQLPGKKALPAQDVLNGAAEIFSVDSRFDSKS